MHTNTAATLYNQTPDGWERTILENVYWEGTARASFLRTIGSLGNAAGTAASNEVRVLIPFTVSAQGKAYLPPKAYKRAEGTCPSRFTLRPKDILVKGICAYRYGPEHPMQELLSEYDGVYTIQTVDTHDQGSAHMRHWEVVGK